MNHMVKTLSFLIFLFPAAYGMKRQLTSGTSQLEIWLEHATREERIEKLNATVDDLEQSSCCWGIIFAILGNYKDEKRIDPNTYFTKDGLTLLHLAVQKEQIPPIQKLLKRGANPSIESLVIAENKTSITPFAYVSGENKTKKRAEIYALLTQYEQYFAQTIIQ